MHDKAEQVSNSRSTRVCPPAPPVSFLDVRRAFPIYLCWAATVSYRQQLQSTSR